MDVLKAELERKRKQIEKAEVVAPSKKFFRRGDLESKQKEEYWKKYNEKNNAKLNKDAASVSTNLSPMQNWEDAQKYNLPRDEAIKRLRERNEPIRLFGETDLDSLKRLRMLEFEAPDIEKGFRNDLQQAMDQVDEDYIKEIIEGQSNEGKHDVVVEDVGVTIKDIIDFSEKDLGKGNVGRDCELILQFINFLLLKWGTELNSRAETEKRSGKGKLISATHTQTRVYLNPLIKMLKSKTVSSDIREHLVNITHCMLKRDYIQANNYYMEMAIGNAPWPVGVTASGIHKRPGSEKLYVRNVAHVLNDETQRKYIQALKRLMTKCQIYFPTDPSKCVEYGGIGSVE